MCKIVVTLQWTSQLICFVWYVIVVFAVATCDWVDMASVPFPYSCSCEADQAGSDKVHVWM